MNEFKRRPRTITMNDNEITMTENVMEYYRLHSVSETVRFLIIRENSRIEAEKAEKAVK